MSNQIKNKTSDPFIQEFATNDLFININEGTLFYRSKNELFRVEGSKVETLSSDFGGQTVVSELRPISASVISSSGPIIGGDFSLNLSPSFADNIGAGKQEFANANIGTGTQPNLDTIHLGWTRQAHASQLLNDTGPDAFSDALEIGIVKGHLVLGGPESIDLVTADAKFFGDVRAQGNLILSGSITSGVDLDNFIVTSDGNITGSNLLITGKLGVGNDIQSNEGKNTLTINHNGSDGNNGIIIVRDDTSVSADNLLGGIGFDSQDGNVPSSILQASAFIAGYADQPHSNTEKGGYLAICVAPLDQNDDTTSTKYVHFYKAEEELTIDSVLDKTAYSYMCRFNSTDSSENNVKVIAVQKNGADALLIYSDGDVLNANNSYGSLSDVRFKTNIVDLKDDSLDKILQLRPVSFNWNEESGNDRDRYMVGYIAQEVEKVLPNIVDTHDNSGNNGLKDEKSINHPHLIPYLVKSIQQLSAKIDKLEKQLKNK